MFPSILLAGCLAVADMPAPDKNTVTVPAGKDANLRISVPRLGPNPQAIRIDLPPLTKAGAADRGWFGFYLGLTQPEDHVAAQRRQLFAFYLGLSR